MYALLFLLGLAVGSFLNVLTLRYDGERPLFSSQFIGGRSRCPSCRTTLRAYELIPLISFVLQRGRCRNCGAHIGFQYPLVELLGGAIAVVVPYYFSVYGFALFPALSSGTELFLASFIFAAVLYALLAIAVIDYHLYLVPDELVVLIALSAVGWIALLYSTDTFGVFSGSFVGSYGALFGLRGNLFINHTVGAVLGAASAGLLFFGSAGRALGFGDVKLFGALGLLFGSPAVMLVFFLSFIFGAAFSTPFLVVRRWGMKYIVPFAPFISLSTVVVFFFGRDILMWYFSFFPIV